jgi:hypothetical protein
VGQGPGYVVLILIDKVSDKYGDKSGDKLSKADGSEFSYGISSICFIPALILSMIPLGSMETCSKKNDLSIVKIWEKLITDVFSSPETAFPSRILGGAFASARFEVSTAHITVLMALRL